MLRKNKKYAMLKHNVTKLARAWFWPQISFQFQQGGGGLFRKYRIQLYVDGFRAVIVVGLRVLYWEQLLCLQLPGYSYMSYNSSEINTVTPSHISA